MVGFADLNPDACWSIFLYHCVAIQPLEALQSCAKDCTFYRLRPRTPLKVTCFAIFYFRKPCVFSNPNFFSAGLDRGSSGSRVRMQTICNCMYRYVMWFGMKRIVWWWQSSFALSLLVFSLNGSKCILTVGAHPTPAPSFLTSLLVWEGSDCSLCHRPVSNGVTRTHKPPSTL